MVVDERGVFKDDSFQAAVAALQDGNVAAATAQSGKGANKGDKKQPKQVITSAQFLGGGGGWVFYTVDMLCTPGCSLQLMELSMMQGFERHFLKQQHTKNACTRTAFPHKTLHLDPQTQTLQGPGSAIFKLVVMVMTPAGPQGCIQPQPASHQD
jgi:hypothetical protein